MRPVHPTICCWHRMRDVNGAVRGLVCWGVIGTHTKRSGGAVVGMALVKGCKEACCCARRRLPWLLTVLMWRRSRGHPVSRVSRQVECVIEGGTPRWQRQAYDVTRAGFCVRWRRCDEGLGEKQETREWKGKCKG